MALHQQHDDLRKHKAFAVRTGRISGIAVIDCNTVDAYTAITCDYPELQQTLTIRTMSGYHMYCYYHAEASTSTNALTCYLHADFRNDKAIVFGPAPTYHTIVTGTTNRYWVTLDHDPEAFPSGLLGKALKPARSQTRCNTKHQRQQVDDGEISSTPEPLITMQTPQVVFAVLERLVRALPPLHLALYDKRIGAILQFESNGAAKDLL